MQVIPLFHSIKPLLNFQACRFVLLDLESSCICSDPMSTYPVEELSITRYQLQRNGHGYGLPTALIARTHAITASMIRCLPTGRKKIIFQLDSIMQSLFLLSLILILCVYLTPTCEALKQRRSLTLSAQRHLKRESVGNFVGDIVIQTATLVGVIVLSHLILDAIRKPRTQKRLRH